MAITFDFPSAISIPEEFYHNTLKFGYYKISDDGYVIQSAPSYEVAETEASNIRIPGRNGDIIESTGSFLNVTRSYYLIKVLNNQINYLDHSVFVRESSKLIRKLKTINYNWLVDTFERDYARKAIFKTATEITNINDEVLAVQVDFECTPQRYLIDGFTDKKELITADGILNNTTECYGKPLIKIKSTSSENKVELNINGKEYKIDLPNDDIIYIDSEMMDCYNDDYDNLNNIVSCDNITYLGDFPTLIPGENTITIQNGIIEQLIPRWWTL